MSNSADGALTDYLDLLLQEEQQAPKRAYLTQLPPPQTLPSQLSLPQALPAQLSLRDEPPKSRLKTSQPQTLADPQDLARLMSQTSVLHILAEPLGDKSPTLLETSPKKHCDPITHKINQDQKPLFKEPVAPIVTASSSNLCFEQFADEFQLLHVRLPGLSLALPLLQLAGIIKFSGIKSLPGSPKEMPKWLLGVRHHRGNLLKILDTNLWLNQDKVDSNPNNQENYQYIILLEGSHWALACNGPIECKKIKKSQVSWRKGLETRPWFTGIVKKEMCALLDVVQLLKPLEVGLKAVDTH